MHESLSLIGGSPIMPNQYLLLTGASASNTLDHHRPVNLSPFWLYLRTACLPIRQPFKRVLMHGSSCRPLANQHAAMRSVIELNLEYEYLLFDDEDCQRFICDLADDRVQRVSHGRMVA